MSDVQIALQLPEELVERAKAAGLEIASITPDVITLIEERIKRREGWQKLMDSAETLRGDLTEEEIEQELAAAKSRYVTAGS